MSHFSRIKTSIREIDLLKKSLVNLNLVWEEKEQLIEGYQGETHKVNLVIRQENNIDIGFEKTKDNSYQLVADLAFWDQPTSVDAFLDSLHKEYALSLNWHDKGERFPVCIRFELVLSSFGARFEPVLLSFCCRFAPVLNRF